LIFSPMITIFIRQVRDLHNIGDGLLGMGKMDPYVKVVYGNTERRTPHKEDAGTKAEFNEKLEVQYDGMHLVAKVQVWERDERTIGNSVDDFIAGAEINLDTMHQGFEGTIQLYRNVTQKAGLLDIIVEMEEHVQEKLAARAREFGVKLPQVIPVKRHRSRLVGRMNAWSAGEPALGEQFFAYELPLHHTPEIFGESYQTYDKKDKTHAALFENPVVNAGTKKEHEFLYRDGVIKESGGEEADNADTIFNTVRTGHDFIELINRGVRAGRRRVFTYCIMDNGMFFSETGNTKSQDFTSKHAVHANGNSHVRYSGCFRVLEHLSGTPALWFDNDSGTYRPKADGLAKVKALMEQNFPGVDIFAENTFGEHPTQPAPPDFLGPSENVTRHESEKLCADTRLATYLGCWNWTSGGHVSLDAAGLNQLIRFKGCFHKGHISNFGNELGIFLERYCEHVGNALNRAQIWELARHAAHVGASYHYIRLVPKQTRDPGAAYVQLGGIRFRDRFQAEITAVSVAYNPGGQPVPHCGPGEVLDPDTKTRWKDPHKSALILQFRSPINPVGMELMVPDTGERDGDLTGWTVEGSNNGIIWHAMNSEAGFEMPTTGGMWSKSIALSKCEPVPEDWRLTLEGLQGLLDLAGASQDRKPLRLAADVFYLTGNFCKWAPRDFPMACNPDTGVYFREFELNDNCPKPHFMSGRRKAEFQILPGGDWHHRLYGDSPVGNQWALVQQANTDKDGNGVNFSFEGRSTEKWTVYFDASVGKVKVCKTS